MRRFALMPKNERRPIKGSEYSMLIIARFRSEPVDINYSDPLNPTP